MPSRKEIVRPTAEQGFGQEIGRGHTVRYAREDHTHGTPLDPVIDVLSKILGSANKVRIDDNGDGTITITLPSSIQLDGSTALRLLATDANKRTVSADLAAWIAGTANQITVTDNADGSVTLSIPNDLIVQQITPQGRIIVPMGEISYFSTTGTAITIAAQSDGSTNMVKVNPTTALSADAYEFDNGGANDGRLRYTGSTTKMFHVACTISVAPAAANDVFVLGIAKNGTVGAGNKILQQIAGISAIQSTALHYMVELATNDYIELYVGNTSDADDFTINTLNLFAMGM